MTKPVFNLFNSSSSLFKQLPLLVHLEWVVQNKEVSKAAHPSCSWMWDCRRIKMSSLRVKMGVVLPLLALLLLCVDAAREAPISIAHDAGRIHMVLDGPLNLHELEKLFQSDVRVPSLDGLPTEFCDSCLEISRKAKKILSDPSLFNEVDYIASSFCHILPSDLEVKCTQMVETHKHETVMFLQDAFLEEKFCCDSGFCPGKDEKISSSFNSKAELLASMEPFIKLLRKLPKRLAMEAASGFMNGATTFTLKEIPVELRSNETCSACRTVLDKVRNELEDPNKQLKIITSLLKACEVEVFVYRCKKLVFAYGPLVISNIQKIVSMDLCHMVHICEVPRNQSSPPMNMMNLGNSGVPHQQSAVAKLDVM